MSRRAASGWAPPPAPPPRPSPRAATRSIGQARARGPQLRTTRGPGRQAHRLGQQPRGVLAGSRVDAAFQVTDGPRLTSAASASSSWVSPASSRSCRNSPPNLSPARSVTGPSVTGPCPSARPAPVPHRSRRQHGLHHQPNPVPFLCAATYGGRPGRWPTVVTGPRPPPPERDERHVSAHPARRRPAPPAAGARRGAAPRAARARAWPGPPAAPSAPNGGCARARRPPRPGGLRAQLRARDHAATSDQ